MKICLCPSNSTFIHQHSCRSPHPTSYLFQSSLPTDVILSVSYSVYIRFHSSCNTLEHHWICPLIPLITRNFSLLSHRHTTTETLLPSRRHCYPRTSPRPHIRPQEPQRSPTGNPQLSPVPPIYRPLQRTIQPLLSISPRRPNPKICAKT